MAIAASPALANVGAACLFTDGVQLELAQLALDFCVLVTPRDHALHPVRLALALLGPEGVEEEGEAPTQVREREGGRAAHPNAACQAGVTPEHCRLRANCAHLVAVCLY